MQDGFFNKITLLIFKEAIRFMSGQVSEHPDGAIVLVYPEEVRGHIEI
jgi:hypothetical protein